MQVQYLGQEDPLEEGMANPLQYSCLENPMDRDAWQATVHKVIKSQTRLKQLIMHANYLTVKLFPATFLENIILSSIFHHSLSPNPKSFWQHLPFPAAAAKSLQSCPTLCDPIDGSPPGSPSLGFSRQEHWSGLPVPSPMHESGKWKWSRSVVSDSSRSHGLQPTRLLHPWDFPGKSTGVGCHSLLQPFLRYHKLIFNHCLPVTLHHPNSPKIWEGRILPISTSFITVFRMVPGMYWCSKYW